MMGKIILDLCGGSGSWSRPYKEAGYDVRIITLPENDVKSFNPPENVYGILAAPPCDEFSMAKNHNIKRHFDKGMEIVNSCLKIIKLAKPKFHALENPIGYLSAFLGPPFFYFHPWWYGDPWTKKTGIWGGFNKPLRKYNNWEDVPKNNNLYIKPKSEKPAIAALHKSAKQFIPWMYKYDPENDAAFRAITPEGFANAFFKVNK